MLALLITIMGAIPEPRYNVGGITLTQSEMDWVVRERVSFEEEALRQVRVIGKRVTEAEADILELEAERDALRGKGEKDAIDAQITKIRDGIIERGKHAIRKVYAASRPSAADARRITIGAVFSEGAIEASVDANNNGTLSRAETGWPVFVFNDVDANSDGALTVAEIEAYLAGL